MSLSTGRTLVATHCPQDKICMPQISLQTPLQCQMFPWPFPPPVKLPSHKPQSWSGGHIPSYIMGSCFVSLFKPRSFSGPVEFSPFSSEPPKCLFLWCPATLESCPLHFSSLCMVGCLQKDANQCSIPAFMCCCSHQKWWPRSLGVLRTSCPGLLVWCLTVNIVLSFATTQRQQIAFIACG